ncbi:hypothetical protein SELMODRAFT_447400 [Selaginella moellendorffii]|uniref:Tryptophan synthase beta chain-like PALP domain-containing protein n=1 Tax=Selaginella moellendorffii TaxID=88036 RepID=D8SZ52_SELML|nr:hypothetical protein SELMODRAFT_447400 [Selaginella moellendorffii]
MVYQKSQTYLLTVALMPGGGLKTQAAHSNVWRSVASGNACSRIDTVGFALKGRECNFHDFCKNVTTKTEKEPHKFRVIRDDLLHPTLGGNKIRKLDAVVPFLKDEEITDVVTCGGCHAAAVAQLWRVLSMGHLLLRGEKLEVTTGYNLISEVYGNVVETITPSENSKLLEPGRGRRKWAVLGEGGASGLALLGFIRLVRWLSENEVFERDDKIKIVVDSGTGTSAIGLALGIALLGLHQWEIVGVMLSGSRNYYERQTKNLVTDFLQQFRCDQLAEALSLPLVWEERKRVRRFNDREKKTILRSNG